MGKNFAVFVCRWDGGLAGMGPVFSVLYANDDRADFFGGNCDSAHGDDLGVCVINAIPLFSREYIGI